MKSRGVILAALVSFSGCVLAPCAGCLTLPTNRVRVVNESSQTAHDLTVSVSGRTYHFGDVRPGGTVACRYYSPGQEDYIHVRCRYDDGTVFNEGCVYVMWEMYFDRYEIALRDEGTYVVR